MLISQTLIMLSRLSAAIIAGSRTDYALQKYTTSAKPDPMFQMTKEQFDQAVDKLIKTTQFETYYKSLSEDVLKRSLGTNQAMEQYSRDFHENALNMQQSQQLNQEPMKVQEQVRVQEQNVGPNM